MSYPILDFTSPGPGLEPDADRSSLMIVPGPKDLVLYHWKDFEHKAPRDRSISPMTWAEFMDFCQERCDLPYQCVDTVCFSGGKLLVDAWCDNYKWGRARSRYTRGLVPMLTRVCDAGLIDRSRTPVCLGNWANGEAYEPLGTLAEIVDDLMSARTMVLWHGTTSLNAKRIAKQGFKLDTVSLNKSKKEAIYFSASAFRASYFARDAVVRQRKLLKKEAPADWSKQKLAAIEPCVIRCLFDRAEVLPHLLPDDDWLSLASHEGIDPGRGFASLAEFGQVAMREVPEHSRDIWMLDKLSHDRGEIRNED